MRRGLLTLLLTASALGGCGAPTKSAGDVAYLFAGDAVSLQSKVGALCDTLSTRDAAPTLKDLTLQVDGCSQAGQAAQNYSQITSFGFIGLDGEVPDAEKDKVIKKTVRGQLWINKSLLGFAAAIDAKFRAGNGKKGMIEKQEGKGGFDSVIDLDIESTEEFAYDQATKNFGGKFHIKGKGIADLDNKIEIKGQMLDGGIAATVRSTEDQKVEKSLVKNMQGLILIMPYAGDVYVDIYFDVEIHNLGLPGLFKEMLGSIMGTGLKLIADMLLED